MDESKAIELYQFFNKEGYDLGDQENFLNSFDDEEKRKELYQFFNKEGYDVGNEEDFVLKKKDSDLPVSRGSYGIYYRSGNSSYFIGILIRS